MVNRYISIGKILNTHGLHGAVRILPLTDYPERFNRMSRVDVFIGNVRRELRIEKTYPYKNYIIAKFKEITDMKTAGELKGGLLKVAREELVALPSDSFYIFEIVGLDVYESGGRRLGKVTDVLQTGANDVYVVDTGSKPLLIPALKQVVREVDLPGRKMVVDLPKGLMGDEN
ncbi:MAG TPA: ribosome maturation factor RimM [Bacillota bacterium]|nr:ribosome maturation factor RimM [Bacillota bacterium]